MTRVAAVELGRAGEGCAPVVRVPKVAPGVVAQLLDHRAYRVGDGGDAAQMVVFQTENNHLALLLQNSHHLIGRSSTIKSILLDNMVPEKTTVEGDLISLIICDPISSCIE